MTVGVVLVPLMVIAVVLSPVVVTSEAEIVRIASKLVVEEPF